MRGKGRATEVEGGDTGCQQKSDYAHQIPHLQEIAPPLLKGGHALSHREVNNQDHQDELREGKKQLLIRALVCVKETVTGREAGIEGYCDNRGNL